MYLLYMFNCLLSSFCLISCLIVDNLIRFLFSRMFVFFLTVAAVLMITTDNFFITSTQGNIRQIKIFTFIQPFSFIEFEQP